MRWAGEHLCTFLCYLHVRDGDARRTRASVHSHTMLTKVVTYVEVWTYITRWLGGRLTICTQRCYRGGGARLRLMPVTRTLSHLRFHLILMKLPMYSTHSLKSWLPVLRSFEEIIRKETHVYLPPRWRELPSEFLWEEVKLLPLSTFHRFISP